MFDYIPEGKLNWWLDQQFGMEMLIYMDIPFIGNEDM